MTFFKKPLGDLGFKMFERNLKQSCIATFPNCVVKYALVDSAAILDQLLAPSQINEKLGEILRANPDAELTKYEEDLGIKIIDVQRRKPEQPEETDETKDVQIGGVFVSLKKPQ
jgi:hypothetical protein